MLALVLRLAQQAPNLDKTLDEILAGALPLGPNAVSNRGQRWRQRGAVGVYRVSMPS